MRENRRSRYKRSRAGRFHLGQGLGGNTAIHFQPGGGTDSVQLTTDFSHLPHHLVDVGAARKSGVNAHHKDKIDKRQRLKNRRGRGGRVERDACFATQCLDVFKSAMQMRTSLYLSNILCDLKLRYVKAKQ